MRRLREHPSAAARSPFPNGEGCDTRMPLFSTQRLSQGGKQRGGGFAAKKGSQPRLAALGSPFQGKGLAWTLPPSYGRRCPEGAEVGWGKRDERAGRFFQVRHYESTAIPISSERIHACVEKQYPRQSLPRVGKVASKASRIGFWRYEREGKIVSSTPFAKAPERR